jgi:hypothetical protein
LIDGVSIDEITFLLGVGVEVQEKIEFVLGFVVFA